MREKRGVPLGTSGVHADLELPAVVLTAVQRVNGVLGVALLVVPGGNIISFLYRKKWICTEDAKMVYLQGILEINSSSPTFFIPINKRQQSKVLHFKKNWSSKAVEDAFLHLPSCLSEIKKSKSWHFTCQY